MPKPKRRATPEEFVRAWQTSASVADVSRKLGMRPATALERARVYRLCGVRLKDIGDRRVSVIVADLNRIIDEGKDQ